RAPFTGLLAVGLESYGRQSSQRKKSICSQAVRHYKVERFSWRTSRLKENQQAGLLLRHLRRLVGVRANDATSDCQLLKRFAYEGNEASFAALVERHGPLVLGVCPRVLGNEQDAED